jgi:hypothetical protein
MTSMEDLPAVRAMFDALGVPTDGSKYQADEGGMINLEEVGFLKKKDVDQLIQSVTHPGGMQALPKIGAAGQAGY